MWLRQVMRVALGSVAFLVCVPLNGLAGEVGQGVGAFFDAEVPRMERALAESYDPGHVDRRDALTDALVPSQFSLTIIGVVGFEIPEAAEVQIQPTLTLNWVYKEITE